MMYVGPMPGRVSMPLKTLHEHIITWLYGSWNGDLKPSERECWQRDWMAMDTSRAEQRRDKSAAQASHFAVSLKSKKKYASAPILEDRICQ